MKRTILLLLTGALLGGGGVWLKYRTAGAPAAGEKPAAEEEPKTTITHDASGNTVIKMGDDAQGDAGIVVTKPDPAAFSPELKAYGHIVDPAPLAALVNELASARAAYLASSNELIRQKTLAAQDNTSARALQTAEAAAQHDLLAIQSAHDRLALSWSGALADRTDLSAFLQSLASQEAALARVDLPAGEKLPAEPSGARLTSLAGDFADAEPLGAAMGVDPATQGRGLLFLLKPNAIKLQPGQAVTAHLKLAGEPEAGVVIPRDAVVRTEGAGWVYVMDKGSDNFTRTKIPLEHPAAGGWFTTGVNTNEYVVTTGAQTLLSVELQGASKPD